MESSSPVQQLKEFDGKKLKSTTKEGLDIEDEDEKKKAGPKARSMDFGVGRPP